MPGNEQNVLNYRRRPGKKGRIPSLNIQNNTLKWAVRTRSWVPHPGALWSLRYCFLRLDSALRNAEGVGSHKPRDYIQPVRSTW
jgi:hypothetical protein